MKNWMWLIVLVFISGSCSKEDKPTLKELRQQEIGKRVNQFVRNKQAECYQKTMERAISMADSLLKLNAVKYIEDSLQRPPLPPKPVKKIKPVPKDTVKNKPFLE